MNELNEIPSTLVASSSIMWCVCVFVWLIFGVISEKDIHTLGKAPLPGKFC